MIYSFDTELVLSVVSDLTDSPEGLLIELYLVVVTLWHGAQKHLFTDNC